jgi:hypothetical protein
MEKLQSALNFLLEKYSIGKKVTLTDETSAVIDGVSFDLLPWRNERRFLELKKLTKDGTLDGISVMRVCRIEKADHILKQILYRELDLCEWILDSEICEIYTVANGRTANTVAKMKSGVVCTIETAATLQNDEQQTIDKHEIICARGVACDRVVDAQIPQNSIYLFSKEQTPKTFTDTDFELFGLSVKEVALVRHTFELAKSQGAKEWNQNAAHLRHLVECSEQSIQMASNLAV